MGNGGCGQSTTAPLCLSFLHTPSPFSRVAPSHRLQPFRVNVLQCGLSMGRSSFRARPPAPVWSCPWAAVWIPAPAWSPPGAVEESLLGCLENLLPSSFSDFGDCRAVYHTLPLTSGCRAAFYPFLSRLSPRHHQLGCGAQPCPVAGRLEPAGTGRAWHWVAPTAPHREHLGTRTQYIASAKISVQLRIGTKADTACTEKQERPITALTKLIGKAVLVHTSIPVL